MMKDKGKILYLGLDPSSFSKRPLIHYPVIKIVPKNPLEVELQKVFRKLPSFTHILFTSKNAVQLFFSFAKGFFHQKIFIAIGSETALYVRKQGYSPLVAKIPTQEGIALLLDTLELKRASVLLPCSTLARPFLKEYLEKRKIPCKVCFLYETKHQKPEPLPSLNEIEEIVFTSPSTVDGFFKIFPSDAIKEKKLHCIGPITKDYLLKKIGLVERKEVG